MTTYLRDVTVHLPCGGLRGQVCVDGLDRRQACDCEDALPWLNCDVSRAADLCIICLRAPAGGTSRYARRACPDCREANDASGGRFMLGRHSLTNGLAGSSRLLAFADGTARLTDWRNHEFARLAAAFDGPDVPLPQWLARWPPGPEASGDAFRRLLARPGPSADSSPH